MILYQKNPQSEDQDAYNCIQCGEHMNPETCDLLEDYGWYPDICHECQCDSVCPHCKGEGYLVTHRIDVDLDRHEQCDHCGGTGRYRDYLEAQGGVIEHRDRIHD